LNASTIRTSLLLLTYFFCVNPCPAQQNGGVQRASIEYAGKKIFDFHYCNPKSCADSVWINYIYLAEIRPLQPTAQFSEELGHMDDSGWLVIKNDVGEKPLNGKIELWGDGAGVAWVKEIRIKKLEQPDSFGRTGWLLDAGSLVEVEKKRFIGRTLVNSLEYPWTSAIPYGAGVLKTETGKRAFDSKKRTLTISVMKNHLPILQGKLESEIADSDQLWKHCVDEVLRKAVFFQQTANFAENFPSPENGVDELILNRSGAQNISIHVEGLGISYPKQIVLNRKKDTEASSWFVTSADGFNEKSWAIRRSLVPDLEGVRGKQREAAGKSQDK